MRVEESAVPRGGLNGARPMPVGRWHKQITDRSLVVDVSCLQQSLLPSFLYTQSGMV